MAPIVDANVFMRGRKRPFERAVTIPEVLEEIKSSQAKLKFDIEDISVQEPNERFLTRVRDKSEEINSPTSDTDQKLAALAYQEDEVLITDDKALQNLAKHLDVEFESFLGEEIEQERRWIKLCENCGEKVEQEKCPKCGSDSIRRKPC